MKHPRNISEFRKTLKNVKLYDLPYVLNKYEDKIYHRIKLGEVHVKSGRLRNLKAKRNAIRDELLLKLTLWKNKELPNNETTPTYADIIESEKYNRFKNDEM